MNQEICTCVTEVNGDEYERTCIQREEDRLINTQTRCTDCTNNSNYSLTDKVTIKECLEGLTKELRDGVKGNNRYCIFEGLVCMSKHMILSKIHRKTTHIGMILLIMSKQINNMFKND